jgi:hypothetical protein
MALVVVQQSELCDEVIWHEKVAELPWGKARVEWAEVEVEDWIEGARHWGVELMVMDYAVLDWADSAGGRSRQAHMRKVLWQGEDYSSGSNTGTELLAVALVAEGWPTALCYAPVVNSRSAVLQGSVDASSLAVT